jgi:hypothetical protein
MRRNCTSSRAHSAFKVVVECHPDGVVAYPVGLSGVVVGEGATIDQALRDVRSAIRFHLETFGRQSLGDRPADVMLADVEVGA